MSHEVSRKLRFELLSTLHLSGSDHVDRSGITCPLNCDAGAHEVRRSLASVSLDCGCITETSALSEDHLPHEQKTWRGERVWSELPEQLRCIHEGGGLGPYRTIVEWVKREVLHFPADPIEPKEWAKDMPEVRAKIRSDEPHSTASWTVRLTCGHFTSISTDVDWSPADGPRRGSPERLREMRAEFGALPSAKQNDAAQRDLQRMLDQKWPRPSLEAHCYTCTRARWIVAYQPVGWLLPRNRGKEQTSPGPPRPTPSRAALERKLERALREAEETRRRLAELTTDEDAGPLQS